MPEPDPLQTAREWLRYARQDLEGAQAAAANARQPPRHACTYAQQATEKAIKSLLALEQAEVPFIHDVLALRERVPSRYSIRTADIDLSPLNVWATASRYPGEPDATEADAEETIALAARAIELVERDFEQGTER